MPRMLRCMYRCMNCYYCDRIRLADSHYESRAAEFDLGSEAPRCAWHWRYGCDHCGEPGHFSDRFFCPISSRVLCPRVGVVTLQTGAFWTFLDWWTLACPDCGEPHPPLDRAEFERTHPWQIVPGAEQQRRWLSSELHLVRYPPARLAVVDGAGLTDADIDATWSNNADLWDAGYDERGDANRRYSTDAVLLDFLGDVRGRRILDAGSGTGYLSRLLARAGGDVTAVENAHRFHEIALKYQQASPLGIDFYHGSISSMPWLEDATFDMVVANYVLMDVREYKNAIDEIARVLKPGGRFVFSLVHNTIDFQWDRPALDSPRKDDRVGWRDAGYFVPRAGYIQWGSFEPFLTFHRPLRDYVAACNAAGLELRDLDEPYLTEEGQRVLPPSEVESARLAPISYVLRCAKV
jgi:SAM-dependent methyltransferase